MVDENEQERQTAKEVKPQVAPGALIWISTAGAV
jgi:hypothetical protein